MKRISLLAVVVLFSAAVTAAPFKSPCAGGATGLIATPTASTGWAGSNMGIDAGMYYLHSGEGSMIPMATLQLFQKLELGLAYDMQEQRGNDMIVHSKFAFVNGKTAVAVGGNYQSVKFEEDGDEETFGQIYLATTYGGNFFSMPAETTLVFGKTFGDSYDNSNIDFSMGFDLTLLPQLFQGYVHWISDFANYSYSVDATGANAWGRGAFNTGMRIAALKDNRKFKLNFDFLMTDALDTNRDFGMSVIGGTAF